ncbi:hypothetical protein CEXT_578281 [Caerostris extrusa]|uniref:Secreted protein n=1 Tax=Caerostris extrusa TaxID=172846 RepID=A0AAV4UF80_CAEEX|nr:hypothetical protein CEXT_578281 [Caerostris extrusa]
MRCMDLCLRAQHKSTTKAVLLFTFLNVSFESSPNIASGSSYNYLSREQLRLFSPGTEIFFVLSENLTLGLTCRRALQISLCISFVLKMVMVTCFLRVDSAPKFGVVRKFKMD